MRYDLHLHSRASDGTLTPTELIELCAEANLELVALTDHDTVSGLGEATEAAAARGLRLIAGSEFTCQWRRMSVHLVALGFNPHAEVMSRYLENLRELRLERAQRIAERLVRKGAVSDVLSRVLRLAGEEGQPGRPHFARVLKETGFVRSEQDAFERYLGQGKSCNVGVEWPALAEAVKCICAAGGVAVIAHPTKYRFTFTKLRELIDDFIAVGGEGLEVSYPGLNPDQARELQRLARQKGLLASAGSDFHAPGSAWCRPGVFPALELNENHILSRLLAEQLAGDICDADGRGRDESVFSDTCG